MEIHSADDTQVSSLELQYSRMKYFNQPAPLGKGGAKEGASCLHPQGPRGLPSVLLAAFTPQARTPLPSTLVFLHVVIQPAGTPRRQGGLWGRRLSFLTPTRAPLPSVGLLHARAISHGV